MQLFDVLHLISSITELEPQIVYTHKAEYWVSQLTRTHFYVILVLRTRKRLIDDSLKAQTANSFICHSCANINVQIFFTVWYRNRCKMASNDTQSAFCTMSGKRYWKILSCAVDKFELKRSINQTSANFKHLLVILRPPQLHVK